MSAGDPVERLEILVGRLERTQAKLDEVPPEEVADVLAEMAEIAKEVQAEVERARRESENAGT